jgi:hypothetical protein
MPLPMKMPACCVCTSQHVESLQARGPPPQTQTLTLTLTQTLRTHTFTTSPSFSSMALSTVGERLPTMLHGRRGEGTGGPGGDLSALLKRYKSAWTHGMICWKRQMHVCMEGLGDAIPSSKPITCGGTHNPIAPSPCAQHRPHLFGEMEVGTAMPFSTSLPSLSLPLNSFASDLVRSAYSGAGSGVRQAHGERPPVRGRGVRRHCCS